MATGATVAGLTLADEQSHHGIRAWLVVFSAALFFFFEFMQVNMFNALDPALMQAFHVNAEQLGQLSANYFYANVIFLFPAGLILDRFSTRKIIITAMAVSVAAAYCFSCSHYFWQAATCRFLTGISGAFCLLSCVRVASRWFPPRRMALVVGLIVTFAMVGGMVAQTPFTLMTDQLGWRHTILIDAIVGTLMLIIMFSIVRDYPHGYDKSLEQPHHTTDLRFWQSILLVAKNTQNWLGGIYTCLMNLPIFIIGAMWGSLYLVQVHHLTRADSSIVTSMIFLGTIIGSPLIGWFSDRIGRRRMPMIVTAIISLALIMLFMYARLNFIELCILTFIIGLVTSAQIISYPLIAESNALALTGSAEGLASTLIMAGGFSQPFVGWIIDHEWQHKFINHIPLYSTHAYHIGFLIMPISFIIAAIAALLIKETYCQRHQ